MHCAAAEGHLTVFAFLIKEPDADLHSATYDGELLEDVVEDDDLRQKVIGMSALVIFSLHLHYHPSPLLSSLHESPPLFLCALDVCLFDVTLQTD